MPASLPPNPDSVPLGANLMANPPGATFRCWAPRATRVWVSGDFNGWAQDDDSLLQRRGSQWVGFVPGVADGDRYKFYVEGEGSEGYKRDPYARELTANWPQSDCIVRDPGRYVRRDRHYHPPAFRDLIIYQLHVGVFNGPQRESRVAKFLDLLGKLDYLVALGINAVQFLPIVEFSNSRSLGYEGSDIFSPEMDYCILDEEELEEYLPLVNGLRARKHLPPLDVADLLPQCHQLQAVVELFHLYGIAVILDVVYNHAGGAVKHNAESLYFFDRAAGTNPNDSLYFTDQDHTGPVWAVWRAEVRQFLIDNALFFINEYGVDGFRYDQVSVIVNQNSNDGWRFCQDLTGTVRYVDPSAVQIAEYWNVDPYVARPSNHGGAGFDACLHDALRVTIRNAVSSAGDGFADMNAIAAALAPPGFIDRWRTVQYVESHDEVYRGRGQRMPALAGRGDSRSWQARSRARVATGLILTAPGIPMLFMGQEFLEDKQWADDAGNHSNLLIWWGGLDSGHDRHMADFHRFVEELTWLRRSSPALRSEQIRVLHAHNGNRVLAFHRWLEWEGRDMVVVASLNDQPFYNYEIGFPSADGWREVFNSDFYDHHPNPHVIGNGGWLTTYWSPRDGSPATARLTIPGNSLLVLAR